MVTAKQQHTASETVVLAADDLMTSGRQEFSEWDLTVAAWAIDRFRFGLRGYAQSYPDHKRVMMEIMGQKASNPIQQKLMEKVRPNVYRLTALGRSVAARLRGGAVAVATKTAGTPVTVRELYDTVAVYVGRPEFRRWQDNPEEPRDWAGAASFLGLAGRDNRADPVERLDEVQASVRAAMDWCTVKEAAFLTRGSGQGGPPIHVRDLSDLLDFLTALSYRFPDHLAKRGGKLKKRFSD